MEAITQEDSADTIQFLRNLPLIVLFVAEYFSTLKKSVDFCKYLFLKSKEKSSLHLPSLHLPCYFVP